MSKNISEKLRRYLLGSRASALAGIIALLKSDVGRLITAYMRPTGDIRVVAELDDTTGDVVFTLTFAANEIYDPGDVL